MKQRKRKFIRGLQIVIVTFLVVYYICPVTVSGVDNTRVENQKINVFKEQLKTEKIDSSIDNSEPKYGDGVTGEKDSGESEVKSEETALENNIEVPILKNSKALPLDNLISKGNLGTGEWGVYEDGTLYFTEGTFENPVSSPVPSALPDWSRYTNRITRVELGGKLICTNSLSKMFSGLKNVKTIENLPLLDTSQATDMSSMFSDMNSLSSLDLSNFDTSKVTNMSYMFSKMSSLLSLDISNFDTSKVTNMSSMFSSMSSLSSLDISNFDTSQVTDMSSMFYKMSSLSSLDISTFDMSKVASGRTSSMFYLLTNMSQLTLGPKNKFSTTNNEKLQAISPSDQYTGKWINNTTGKNIWTSDELMKNYRGNTDEGEYVWQSINKWGEVPWEFDEDSGTLTFTGTGVLGESLTSPWSRDDILKIDGEKIEKIIFQENVSAPINSSYLFSDAKAVNLLSNVQSIMGLEKMDTSQVNSMYSMFDGMRSLTSLDVANFNTSNVENMTYMFLGLRKLKSLNVTNFDTRKVIGMGSMFNGLEELENLDVTNFNTSNVTIMESMFKGLSKLKKLDVSNFDTRKVKNSDYMFAGLKNIVDLDVSKFESSSSVKNMFDGMDKVTKLDVSGFRVNSNVDHMFRGTNNMKELVLGSNFDTYYLRKTDIPEISKEKPYTGNWINADTKEIVGSSSKFMNMRPIPGTYKWEIGDFLELNLVPNSIDFETTLESDEYLATQNFENSSIIIYNSLLERNWEVKATIQNDELITSIDETKNSYPVTSFLMNDVELVGTGATGIVMQAQQDKTSENNTGEIAKKVDTVKINFLDTKSSLKVGNKLVGQINYQLYNTPNAN